MATRKWVPPPRLESVVRAPALPMQAEAMSAPVFLADANAQASAIASAAVQTPGSASAAAQTPSPFQRHTMRITGRTMRALTELVVQDHATTQHQRRSLELDELANQLQASPLPLPRSRSAGLGTGSFSGSLSGACSGNMGRSPGPDFILGGSDSPSVARHAPMLNAFLPAFGAPSNSSSSVSASSSSSSPLSLQSPLTASTPSSSSTTSSTTLAATPPANLATSVAAPSRLQITAAMRHNISVATCEPSVAQMPRTSDIQTPAPDSAPLSPSASARASHAYVASLARKPHAAPPRRRYIGENEWASLQRLTSFTELEMERVYIVFCARQQRGLVAPLAFFHIMCEVHEIDTTQSLPSSPAEDAVATNIDVHADIDSVLSTRQYLRFYLHPDSLIAARMFAVFDVLKLGALTFLEFTLALGVMCGRSTFLDPVKLAFDTFDVRQDKRLSRDELHACAACISSKTAGGGGGALELEPEPGTDEARVVAAVDRLLAAALATSATPDSLTKDEFAHLAVRFPRLLDAFTFTFEQFCVNVDLTASPHAAPRSPLALVSSASPSPSPSVLLVRTAPLVTVEVSKNAPASVSSASSAAAKAAAPARVASSSGGGGVVGTADIDVDVAGQRRLSRSTSGSGSRSNTTTDAPPTACCAAQ